MNGITLWHAGTKGKKVELEKFSPAFEKEKIESVVVLPETVSPAETKREEVLIEKKSVSKRSQPSLKALLPYFHKKVHPDKPASRFKVSVSQINTLAVISFLCVPLFIASLFTSSIFLILSTFSVGVILATIAGFLADGRKGCWMVGIAIGFWVVIVLYMALLLFVF